MFMQFNPSIYLFNSYHVITNSLDIAKSSFRDFNSLIKNIFYENTLFFAVNNQALANTSQKYKDLSWVQKFKIGTLTGVKRLLSCYLISECLDFALRGKSHGYKARVQFDWPLLVISVVIEEVLFRGIVQNLLEGSQKIAVRGIPQSLQNNRVFKWFTSPSARIVIANTVFAAAHLFNDYQSTKSNIQQFMFIMLLPVEGILNETTGDIIAPIACHSTNNSLAWLLYHITK